MIITGDPKLIVAAFIKARGEMSATVTKDKKGNFGDYATLAALVEATATSFAKHNLAIIQEAELLETGVTVATWLVHESGSTIEFTPLTMPLTDRRPQAVGSAITYARRYQLASVCGLAPDDDDGQAAQDATPATKPQKRQEPQQAQHRQNDAAKAQSTPQGAPVQPTGDNPFEGPSDEELEVLGIWKTPDDAKSWAIENKSCLNEHEARESFKKVVDANGGKLNKENIGLIYLLFLRRQNDKLKAQAQPSAGVSVA